MSLRVRLLLLVLIAAVPVLGVQVQTLLAARAERLRETGEVAAATADSLAVRVGQFVETARALSVTAGHLPEVRQKLSACSERLRELAAGFPSIRGIGAVGVDGHAFCRSSGGPSIYIGDRPYFQAVLREKRFVASGLLIGRAVNSPGIVFAAPSLGRANSVEAVVLVAVGLDELAAMLAQAPLPQASSIRLFDADGGVLASVPAETDAAALPRDWLAGALAERQPRTLRAEDATGAPLIHALAPVPAPGGFAVAVSAPLSPALAQIESAFWRDVAVLAAIFVLAGLAAFYGGEQAIRRPVRRLQELAGRLAAGDLAARAPRARRPAPEIGALADSLDAMAAALQRQQAGLRESEQRFRDIAANFPGVIVRRVTRPDGRVEYPFVSDNLPQVLGFALAQAQAIRHVEDIAAYMAPEDLRRAWAMSQEASERLVPLDFEAPLLCPDGEVRWIRSISRPHRRADGATIWDGVVLNVTEQKRAEAQRERLAAIIAASRDAIWSWSLDDRRITSWNPQAERMFGYAPSEAIGQSLEVLVPPERRAGIEEVAAALRQGRWYQQLETERVRKDGTSVPVEISLSPLRDAEGRIVEAATIARDISERHLAQERQEMLTAELDHRVKNLLAAVQAVAQLTLPRSADVEAYLDRIRSLAAAHAMLAEQGWTGVDLEQLVSTEVAPYQAGERVQVTGPPVQLDGRQAQNLALAMHELLTNAAKYGSLSVPQGRIVVSWAVEAGRRLVLEWCEVDGPAIAAPVRFGFGTRFLRQAVDSVLQGELMMDFRPSGLRCRIAVPLAAEDAAPADAASDGSAVTQPISAGGMESSR